MGTDASNQAIVGILSQYQIVNGANQLPTIKYHTKTLSAAQCNWPIYDQELFTIVDSFWKWRYWLVGVDVNVGTDHEGMQCFYSKRKRNFRQASWYLDMSEFRYHIHQQRGTKMGKLNGLSRRSGVQESGMDVKFVVQGQLLDLEEYENDNEGNAEDIELEGIDVSQWDKRNGLWLVPE